MREQRANTRLSVCVCVSVSYVRMWCVWVWASDSNIACALNGVHTHTQSDILFAILPVLPPLALFYHEYKHTWCLRCSQPASKQTEFLICYVNHTLASRIQFTYAKLVCSYSCWLFGSHVNGRWRHDNNEYRVLLLLLLLLLLCACIFTMEEPYHTHIHVRFSLSPSRFASSLSLTRCVLRIHTHTHTYSWICYVIAMKRTTTTTTSIPNGRLEAEYIPNTDITHATRTHTQTQTRCSEREARRSV